MFRLHMYVLYCPTNSPGLFDNFYFKIFPKNLGLYSRSAYSRGRLISNFFFKISTYYRGRHHVLGVSLHKHDFISNFFQKSWLIFEVGLFPGSAYLTLFFLKFRPICGVGLFSGSDYLRSNTVFQAASNPLACKFFLYYLLLDSL